MTVTRRSIACRPRSARSRWTTSCCSSCASAGGRTPFGTPEVEAMSRAGSPSTARRYGTARVCRVWEVPRSTLYERRARASRTAQPAAKRGPKQAWSDAALTEQIRSVLASSPFIGEGYRKAWARLRLAGVRTSRGRVLRLMRKAGLLAATRVGRRRGPRNHDGTITTERPDEMWEPTPPPTSPPARATPPSSSRSTTAHRSAPASTRLAPARASRRWSRCARGCGNTSVATGRASPPDSACATTTAAST